MAIPGIMEALLKEAYVIDENYRHVEKERGEVYGKVVEAMKRHNRHSIRVVFEGKVVTFSLCNNMRKLNIHVSDLDGVIE